jgi:nicotinamidase-related amidase
MKRALLIIDVQNEYVDGNLRITYPNVAQSLNAMGVAMDAANDAQIPIVVVQTLAPETAPIFARHSHGAELHASVTSRERALLLVKPLPSCLSQTNLESWLYARKIDTVTLAGYMTHNCVDATARHASHLGFKVEVLSDATGSVPYANSAGIATAEELHHATLTILEARFARVMTTAQWCSLLPDVDSPKPTGIFQSNQAFITGKKHNGQR